MFNLEELERLKEGLNQLNASNIMLLMDEKVGEDIKSKSREKLESDKELLKKVLMEIEKLK